jgi:DNA polymerase
LGLALKIPTQILGLDWETYYDDEYTLKKLTTTAYIRDDRFQIHGAALRWNHEKKSTWFPWEQLAPYLKTIDWEDTALLAHHAHFDGLILTHHAKVIPAYYYDTLSMARALYSSETRARLDDVARYLGIGTKVAGYLDDVKGQREPTKTALRKLAAGARRDCDLMWQIFRIMIDYLPEEELDLIHYTVKCFTEPVLRVNTEKAMRAHRRVIRERRAMLKRVAKAKRFTQEMYEQLSTQLRSRKQFPEMLRELGVEPPLKISKAWLDKPVEEREEDKKYTYALAANDLAFTALKEHPNRDVRELVEAKLMVNSSIHETRPLRMIEHSDPALTIYLNYWGAKTTGRWSGGDKMNPQNLGRDGELRNAIEPPPGHVFVVGDSSAIEAVLNAWFAGQWDLLEQFSDPVLRKHGEDPYTIMASDIYGRKITKKDKTERFVGKVTILGCGYQMGAPKLQFTFETGMLGPVLVLDQPMYKRIIDVYRYKMHAIQDQWWTFNTFLKKMMHEEFQEPYRDCLTFAHESVQLPNEMWLRYPNLRYATTHDEHNVAKENITYRDKTKIYGGKLVENIIQATARVVVGQQYLRIADMYRMVLLAHDEIVLVVPKRKAKKAADDLLQTLKEPPWWCKDAPLNGEVGVFNTYVKM